jgi:hypothetical protein
MKARWRMFEEPPPAGWLPAVGEEVVLAPKAGTIGKLTSRAKVVGIGGGCARVKAPYGHSGVLNGIFAFEDLRPFSLVRRK